MIIIKDMNILLNLKKNIILYKIFVFMMILIGALCVNQKMHYIFKYKHIDICILYLYM